MKTAKCEKCIFYDVCDHECPCDDFYCGDEYDNDEYVEDIARNVREEYANAWNSYVNDDDL